MALALVAFLLYADVLWDSSHVATAEGTDVALYFLRWREFGFGEMAKGHIPLWNPYLFGGAPYVASFQSALFYPLNWLHLFLPAGLAISWYCAIHTFLMGFFTSLWARFRGISISGQILSGSMMMLCGQFFLRVFAGHLANLGAMVWVPLILLAVDGLAAGGSWRWGLVGCGALAMQILAGHPQYIFYTGLFLSLYVLLKLAFSPFRLRCLLGMAGIYAGGALLGAIQLLPGIKAAGESLRSSGLSYATTAQFSLHPLLMLTSFSPYLFGNQRPAMVDAWDYGIFYFGPGLLWESCLFVSVSGAVLALFGLCTASRANRVINGALMVALILLSAGKYTPLHRAFYDYVPFFNSFRAPARFMFFVTLLAVVLAGEGLDSLRGCEKARRLRNAVLLAEGVLILLCVGVAVPATGWWKATVASLGASSELVLLPAYLYRTPHVMSFFEQTCVQSLTLAIATLAAIACCLHYLRPSRAASWLFALAILELLLFAATGRGLGTVSHPYPQEWAEALRDNPGLYRCWHAGNAQCNDAVTRRAFDMWGYDQGILYRYAALIGASQGVGIDQIPLGRFQISTREPCERLYRMFRLRWVLDHFTEPPKAPFLPAVSRPIVITCASPMPQAALIGRVKCIPKLDDEIRYLNSKEFDPTEVVVTEEFPSIPPAGESVSGQVATTNINTDTLVIHARTDKPAILLITDNYAEGWEAWPLGESAQAAYQVIPANVCLRGIPLRAGEHNMLLQYRPVAYVVGKWITLGATIAYLLLLLLACRQRRRG